MATDQRPRHVKGQTMVELALVMPLFTMVLFGIIVLGIGVFYQQQLTNVAREAARFAAISSATAQCPVVGSLDPASPPLSYPLPGGCDRKVDGWPKLTTHSRDATFGLPKSAIHVSACWSGYRKDTASGAIDAPPPGIYDSIGTITSVFVQCHIDGHDPATNPEAIGCASGMPTTDEASSLSDAVGRPVANTVTAFSCYAWNPPLAGFLLIPDQVILRAVVTEAIQRQQ